VGELRFPLVCCHCKCCYATLYNYIRHVKSYHSEDSLFSGEPFHGSLHRLNTRPDASISADDGGHSDDRGDIVNTVADVQHEGVQLVAALRANSSVPYNVIPKVVDSFNQMSSLLTSVIQEQTLDTLVLSGINHDTIATVKEQLDIKRKDVTAPLDFLNSRYRQDKYFNSHSLCVKPESVALGNTVSCSRGKSRIQHECFQYISVEGTLRSLLQSEDYVKLLLHDRYKADLLVDYTDGSQFKTHPLFSDCTKFSVMIQLFYDGLGVTNPLRGQSTLHNVGVFFYSIRNLPQQHNSCFANVHLLALCKSTHIKKYGFDPILEKFVHEMNSLSRCGFAGDFPVIGHCTVYASLCQVTCDNLALNGMLGYIESFSCDFFCSLCYATQNEIQKHFVEELFDMRTKASYDADVHKLQSSTGVLHVRGVKRVCKLNEIDGFHITSNWSLDCLHCVIEGTVPYELGCILYELCNDVDGLDIDVINSEIQLFWGKLTTDKAHRPLKLTKLEQSGHGLSPSMKALQYWALLKYLPLILGNLVSPENEHWKFLLHLSHLVDLILAPRFTRNMVYYLKAVIADHLSMFVELYGGAGGKARLRPKHHFLVHFPNIILNSGPLVGMSCLRYEMKNSFFKRSAHIVCNFTNSCQTLAYRHQQRALYSLLSGEYRRNTVTVSLQRTVPICSLQFSQLLCQMLGVEGTDDISVATKLSVASTKYTEGQFLLVGEDGESGLPQFGRIQMFVSHADSDDWHIVTQCVTTVEFSAHVHAYCICYHKPETFSLFGISELLDYHPLHCHSPGFASGVYRHFIRMPYHVVRM